MPRNLASKPEGTFNVTPPPPPPKSNQSGGRRQEAENDHGSERSKSQIAWDIYIAHRDHYPAKAVRIVEDLIREVSARSADTEGVLERIVNELRSCVRADNDRCVKAHDDNDTQLAQWMFWKAQGVLDAIIQIQKKFQNQTTESGQGPAR